MIIGMASGLENWATVAPSVAFAFLSGYSLTLLGLIPGAMEVEITPCCSGAA